MNARPDASTAAPATYGLLGSLFWTVLGIVAWFLAQLTVVYCYIAWQEVSAPGTVDARKLAADGTLLAIAVILSGPVWIGVVAAAARLRGWSVRGYLALIAPRRSEILFGIACLAPLLIAFDLLSLALGREVVPAFMRESYLTAKAAGSLPLFFIAVVIVGPVAEEIAFRGFLFRGLSTTWLGIAGTLAVSSGLWAAMHIQYDLFLVGQIFLIGLVLGWLRWASGSTLLTILLHVLANLGATLEAMIYVEWFS
jgi:membrane protease YdiL (CAAX protease family)